MYQGNFQSQILNVLYCQVHQGQGYQSVQQPEKKDAFLLRPGEINPLCTVLHYIVHTLPLPCNSYNQEIRKLVFTPEQTFKKVFI